MADTKALLLVYDQQTKILELHSFLQKLVGADDQIHLTRPQILQGAFLGRCAAESAEHINIYREATETGNGGLIMLLGQYGRRHQNGSLLSVHNGLHNGTHGNLGLAKAYIAAQQTVHRDGGLHIMLDLADAAQLIVGFGVGEMILKFPLPGRICRKGKALLTPSGSIELDQLTGHILGCFAGLGLCFLPGIRADLVQPHMRIIAASANIFADHIQLRGRYEQRIRTLISDLYIVLDRTVHLDLLHGHKTANTIVLMDDQISGAQIRK